MKVIKFAILALIILGIANTAPMTADAQSRITGSWTANEKWNKDHDSAEKGDKGEKEAGKIHLNFTRRTEGNGYNNHGSSFNISDLQGLSENQISSANSNVSFRLVREAGTIECTGVFTNGKGVGDFTFIPNQSFVDGMKSRGYANLSDDRLFSSATINLTLGFVDQLKTANFGELSINDVFKAKIFNITPQFMAEMKTTGFPDLGMEELVKARIFKIDADFVRDVVEMGMMKDSFEGLVKLRIFKVTPDFLREMKASGYNNITAEDAVNMRIFKITPDYISTMKAAGFPNLTLDQAKNLAIFKVTPEFINEMKAEGLNNLTVEQAKKLKIFKIDAEFIRKARAENATITVEALVNRKIGVPMRAVMNSREM